MGRDCFCYRLPYCMVHYEQMASEFCIQNGDELVDICTCRDNCVGNSIAYRELAELVDGNKEPGGSSPV